MIDYVYTAKNTTTGEIVKANVKAESPQAAARLLSQQNLFALDISPQEENSFLSRVGIGNRIGIKDKVLFTRQLSTLINAGLPLSRALRTVQDQIGNPALKAMVESVTASVEGGSTLSAAFAQYPKVFNEIYVALVAAGETSGTLDKTLLRLATQQEKDAAIISKIRSALIYPAIVLVLIIGVVTLMVVQVVPQVASLYDSLHKDLPLITKILVWMANFVKGFWWLVLIGLGGLGFAGRRLAQTERFKLWFDKFKLTVLVFGPIFKKVYMARFARTMNTLLASGVPMLQAMETTRNAVNNRVVAIDVDRAIKEVRGGKSLSQALERSPSFLKLVPQMTKIGEESGAIDSMLEKVAIYYEDEVDEAVKNLSTTLEPMMMVILGVIVALVLAAVLGPVYSLVGSGGVTSSLK